MPSTHPLRSLLRTPAFAIAAVLTLALGIGAVATTFAIVHGVLLEPLPYGHPDRLVSVGLRSAELPRIQQPPAVYLTYDRFARRIETIGFHRTGNANIAATGGVTDPARVTASWVTASTIPLLGVTPLLGRSFTEEEDRNGGPHAAIISESVWRTWFGASTDVLGRTLIVNSIPRQVVGVMPDRFLFPSPDTKLWLPARLDRDPTSMGDFAWWGVGRLAPAASAEEAQDELAALLPRLAESFPRLPSGSSTLAWLDEARPVPVVAPLRDEVTRGIARTLWLLAVAAGLVLFVSLANVANLMLIRADARQLELAVREALGASRWRIGTHFLAESVLLAAAAGGAALVAAWAAIRTLRAFGPAGLPRIGELHVGLETIAIVLALSLGAALVCTTVPLIHARSSGLWAGLRDGGRGETAGRARQRVRSMNAAFQLAVAFAVIAGSALLLRTFERLHRQRPGFDPTNVVTIWTQLPFARYDDPASVAFYARLTESAAALPGVVAAGVTARLPLRDGESRQLSFRRDDGRTPLVETVAIGGGYFAAMRIPLLAGAGFRPLGVQRDGEIILSLRAVATLFDGAAPGDAIGRRLALAPSGPTYTVIGVVGDVRGHDLAAPPAPTAYMPQAVPIDAATEPAARRTMALIVRTARPAEGVEASVRRIVRDLDPTVPIFNVETMSSIVRTSTSRLSFLLAAMSAAAAVTLLLGAIGLYGVIAYTVALRTRELGIRIALGADPAGVARTVMLRALALAASGVAAGLVLYALVTPVLRGFLYGVTPADPVTLAAASAALLATAAIASWLPARRAARVDPAVTLRAE